GRLGLGDAWDAPSDRRRGSRVARAARDRATDRQRAPSPPPGWGDGRASVEGGPVDRTDARAGGAAAAVGDRGATPPPGDPHRGSGDRAPRVVGGRGARHLLRPRSRWRAMLRARPRLARATRNEDGPGSRADGARRAVPPIARSSRRGGP